MVLNSRILNIRAYWIEGPAKTGFGFRCVMLNRSTKDSGRFLVFGGMIILGLTTSVLKEGWIIGAG